jgi:ribosome-associated toxin RatA of RatAB toxin-antitoxin module
MTTKGGFTMRTTMFVVTLLLLSAGCGGEGVDWSQPETLIVREKSATTDEGVQLQYWSLLDAPCQQVFDALADVEHYPDFIPGIDSVQLMGQTENSKTVLMGQRVISRMASAKVEWTFSREPLRIDFKTLTSDFAFNDGTYTFEPSPDGTRFLVHFTFLVKPAKGAGAPEQSAVTEATRESFAPAVGGVKKRAVSLAGR